MKILNIKANAIHKTNIKGTEKLDTKLAKN